MRPAISMTPASLERFLERGGEQPRCIERLQQVVAGGGDEARLGGVGFLCEALRRPLRLQCRLQFLRSFLHALLKRELGLDQRVLGAL